jgi:hypothetical protein
MAGSLVATRSETQSRLNSHWRIGGGAILSSSVNVIPFGATVQLSYTFLVTHGRCRLEASIIKSDLMVTHRFPACRQTDRLWGAFRLMRESIIPFPNSGLPLFFLLPRFHDLLWHPGWAGSADQ